MAPFGGRGRSMWKKGIGRRRKADILDCVAEWMVGWIGWPFHSWREGRKEATAGHVRQSMLYIHSGSATTELGYKVGLRLRELVLAAKGRHEAGLEQPRTQLLAHICSFHRFGFIFT